MSNVARNLARLLVSQSSDGERFVFLEHVGPAFLGIAPSRRPALVLPIKLAGEAPVGRASGGVALTFSSDLNFNVEEKVWSGAAAIIECLDPRLVEPFCALAVEFVAQVSNAATVDAKAVGTAFAEWEALFRPRPRLSAERELGLWGEVWWLSHSPSLDEAIDGWVGPDGEAVDFFSGGIGIECKTSPRRLQHEVSLTQLNRPRGDRRCFLVSIWVSLDPGAGRSLPELIDDVRARCAQPARFERKLSRAGYSPIHSHEYSTRWNALETPRWIPVEAVSRVRNVDPGVSNVRFTVSIDEDLCITEAEARQNES